ncbi:transglycosylase SLT domain-containing protein [Shewanella salipaludis]|uniref:Transglycosylase SLT domain-containing protein n=1 Tax=Shewanella salipaludis TaxID=2723052 RepID=A0A972FW92_9GAMM|nr:transglycosylase SLT domain-containing protein [Shewanella salipaludis]NMH63782.1 transglycosylase SLT domain-containing protein [Shewanella salipaludis]
MRKPLINMVLSASILLVTLASAPLVQALTIKQQQYLDAKKALDKGKRSQYQRLRRQLDDYPLAVYLDYHEHIDKLLKQPASSAKAGLAPFKGLPLYNSARYRYLMASGSQRRWQDFLQFAAEPPNNTQLQCFYYRAKLAQGEHAAAYRGAASLWLNGNSLPQECDPLFHAWAKAGQLSQTLIWERMLLSFDAGQAGLLGYLAKKVTTHQSYAKKLIAVYRDPNSLRHRQNFSAKASILGDVVAAGLRKLARKDLAQAVSLYVKYQQAGRFSDHQGRQLNRYLVRRALIRQESSLKDHIDTMLPLLESDDLYEMRLRWAIREQDTRSISLYLDLLSDATLAKSRWQFWYARSHGASPATEQTLSALSRERDFYGFYSALSLANPISLRQQHATREPLLVDKLADDPGLARVRELLALEKLPEARGEWVLLLGRHDNDMQAQYALYALQQGWDDLSVQASIQGRFWNDLPLRFPFAHQQGFEQASEKFKVDIDEIRAIARRESAFYPYATSGVGARGLMQLMPATAKQTARKQALRYAGPSSLYSPELNLQLGSAYYAQLLEEFNQNRVLATAAYNAGPHRVRRWLADSQGKLDVMSFIETIPFTETREYVQAVLSYRLIYQAQQNKPLSLFNEAELNFGY